MTRLVSLIVIAAVLPGCGSGKDAGGAAAGGPSTFGPTAVVTRYSFMGAPTELARVEVPLAAERGVMFLNVAVGGRPVARDQPVPVVQTRYAVAFAADPTLADCAMVKVEAALGSTPLGDGWTPQASWMVAVTAAEARLPANPADGFVGGAGPNCGMFAPSARMTTSAKSIPASTTWMHPHPPCDPTTQHADVTVPARHLQRRRHCAGPVGSI